MLILQFNQLNHKRKFHFHILPPSPKTLSLIRWWTFASFLDVYGHHAEVQLSGFDFHGVLIDEVAQATETSCILAPPRTDTMEIRTNWPCLFGQSSCLLICRPGWSLGVVALEVVVYLAAMLYNHLLPSCYLIWPLLYQHWPTSFFRSFRLSTPISPSQMFWSFRIWSWGVPRCTCHNLAWFNKLTPKTNPSP